MSDDIKNIILGFFSSLESEYFSQKNIPKNAADKIAGKVNLFSQRCLADVYRILKKETFDCSKNQTEDFENEFYGLDLRKKITDKFVFDVRKTSAFTSYKTINAPALSISTAVACGVATGILLGVASKGDNIPAGVIAIAPPAVALLSGALTGFQISPAINRNKLKKLLYDIEKEVFTWIDEICDYYNDALNTIQ